MLQSMLYWEHRLQPILRNHEEKEFHISIFNFLSYWCNYSAPPMGMSNRLTVVLQQELH